MMCFLRILLVAAVVSAVSIASSAASDVDLSLYGTPDPSNPAYSEFAFLRGEWSVAMVGIDAEGIRTVFPRSAQVTAFYQTDGRTFQSCFRMSGFHSTDIQAYDEKAGEWRAFFLNSTLQRWSGFTSQRKGSIVHRFVKGGFTGTGDDMRTVARDITESSFVSDVFGRMNGAEEWVQTYEMTYTRLPNAEHGPRC